MALRRRRTPTVQQPSSCQATAPGNQAPNMARGHTTRQRAPTAAGTAAMGAEAMAPGRRRARRAARVARRCCRGAGGTRRRNGAPLPSGNHHHAGQPLPATSAPATARTAATGADGGGQRGLNLCQNDGASAAAHSHRAATVILPDDNRARQPTALTGCRGNTTRQRAPRRDAAGRGGRQPTASTRRNRLQCCLGHRPAAPGSFPAAPASPPPLSA